MLMKMPYLEVAGFQLSKNIKFVKIGSELTKIWWKTLPIIMLPFITNKAVYICVCVCVSVCVKRGMHNAECHFDFLSHLSSELLASCTVGFRNVAGILLNCMNIFFKMADRQIAKFCNFVEMADIANIKIFLDSCESWLSEKIDFLKIAS